MDWTTDPNLASTLIQALVTATGVGAGFGLIAALIRIALRSSTGGGG